MAIFDEGKVYDTFGDEWRYKAIINDDNDIYVNCRKFGSWNKVDFFIPYNSEWDTFPGKIEGINKITYEIHKRIDF